MKYLNSIYDILFEEVESYQWELVEDTNAKVSYNFFDKNGTFRVCLAFYVCNPRKRYHLVSMCVNFAISLLFFYARKNRLNV